MLLGDLLEKPVINVFGAPIEFEQLRASLRPTELVVQDVAEIAIAVIRQVVIDV
jgi:hypothetical protein